MSNDHEVAGAPVPNASVSNVNSTKVQKKISKTKKNIENSLNRINNIGITNNFRTLSVLIDSNSNSKDNLLLYVDKEKAFDWLVQQPSNSADVNSPIKGLDSATKVVENFENPKDKATIFHKEAIDQEAELQNSKKAPLQNSDALSSSSPIDGTVDGNPSVSHVTQPDGTPLPNDTSVENSAKLKKNH